MPYCNSTLSVFSDNLLPVSNPGHGGKPNYCANHGATHTSDKEPCGAPDVDLFSPSSSGRAGLTTHVDHIVAVVFRTTQALAQVLSHALSLALSLF